LAYFYAQCITTFAITFGRFTCYGAS